MHLLKFFVKNGYSIFRRYKSISSACPPPPPTKFIVTILDMSERQGEALALLLKQSPMVKELRLYDENHDLCGLANDLGDIDTSAKVKSYTGLNLLKCCLADADVVISVGGGSSNPNERYEDLFERNAAEIRNIALYLTEFNTKAVFCIAKPPVESMVPLAFQVYQKALLKRADERIIGIVNYPVMRANSYIAEHLKVNPYNVRCAIVGGATQKTTIAIVSQAKPGSKISNPRVLDNIQNSMAHGENNVLKVKINEEGGMLNIAPAVGIYRIVTSILKGFRGEQNSIECAFVKQEGHLKKFLPYMTSVIRLGKNGVVCTHMPEMCGGEIHRLKNAYPIIRKHIHIGESYVTASVLSKYEEPLKCATPCKTFEVKRVDDEKPPNQKIIPPNLFDICSDKSEGTTKCPLGDCK